MRIYVTRTKRRSCLMKRSIIIVGLAALLLTLVLACGRQEAPARAEQKTRLYDEPNMAIMTYYPDNMKVDDTCSGEGCGFTFRFIPQGNALDKAEIHLFLPRGAATAVEQEPFVIGPNGLLENNGWKMVGESRDTGKFPYGWVRKVISFSDPQNKNMVGKILLGEASGQAVQVMLYYPNDEGTEFLANTKIILEKLHFKSDKLPLGKKP
jgi:hypothetical protein